ncbi:MAG: hypothetical protein ACI3W9_07775 [Eubacteriales bacterium]
MKKLVSVLLAMLLAVTGVFALTASAAEEDTIIHSLLPSNKSEDGVLTSSGCTIAYNDDGSVTITLTATAASVTMTYIDGSIIYADHPFNVNEGAYFVYDYASADGAELGGTCIAYYTRKDKEAAGTYAELWLVSMESSDYAQYSKASGEGFGIWDLGSYISSSDAKKFDDGLHRFVSVTFPINGPVGSSLTLYRYYIGTADSVEGLGSVRPTVNEVSEPEESVTGDTSVDEVSTEPEVSEDEVSTEPEVSENEASAEPDTSAADVSAEPEESKADEESEVPSAADESADTGKENGASVWLWVGIAAAVIAAAVIVFVIVKKNKK